MKKGIFGGSFDPVHCGHHWIVEKALQEGLEAIVVIPCYLSPHKLDRIPQATSEQRWELLQTVFLDDKRVFLSDRELNEKKPSYTWETLRDFRNLEPNTDWVLIVGGDQFRVIETWTKAGEWIYTTEFLVFPRRGESNLFEEQKQKGLRFRVLNDYPPEVSSSEIRKKIKNNLSCEGMLDPRVAHKISDWNLYL